MYTCTHATFLDLCSCMLNFSRNYRARQVILTPWCPLILGSLAVKMSHFSKITRWNCRARRCCWYSAGEVIPHGERGVTPAAGLGQQHLPVPGGRCEFFTGSAVTLPEQCPQLWAWPSLRKLLRFVLSCGWSLPPGWAAFASASAHEATPLVAGYRLVPFPVLLYFWLLEGHFLVSCPFLWLCAGLLELYRWRPH